MQEMIAPETQTSESGTLESDDGLAPESQALLTALGAVIAEDVMFSRDRCLLLLQKRTRYDTKYQIPLRDVAWKVKRNIEQGQYRLSAKCFSGNCIRKSSKSFTTGTPHETSEDRSMKGHFEWRLIGQDGDDGEKVGEAKALIERLVSVPSEQCKRDDAHWKMPQPI